MSVLRNPFFLLACLVFWLNQFLEKILGIYIPYAHAYLDDLLAMPVVLGITLQVYRWIHPLRENFTFSKAQVVVGLVYFSFLFEFLLPRWSTTYTADLWDVFCYGIGAIIFYKLINIKS